MSPKLTAYFREYQLYHRSPGNKVCHYFGIPLIAIATLGLLSLVRLVPASLAGSPLVHVDAGLVLWFFSLLFYCFLDWKVGISFSFVTLGIYFIGQSIPWPGLVALFVIGWVLQLVGHGVYEKKSPAFMDNITHLLIGPIWVFASLMGFTDRSKLS